MDHQSLVEATDAALAQAWAAGDERAYEHIVGRHATMVFNRCRIALGAVDADDATQAVFLILARKRDQAAASPVLAAWLMTVAAHVVRNAARDRQRRRAAESSLPPPPPIAEEPAMTRIRDHLDACLAALPAKEREAVTLHHLAGCTLAEVARQTRSGISTVHARAARGLERLRALLVARGVTLGAAALVAALASEAQAAVPAEVMVHLRELAPAGGGAGTTAVPSDRAHHWSRSRPSPMTTLALTAAGLLLAGGAILHLLPSAEPAPAHPASIPAAAAVDPVPPLDWWTIIRVNDLGRMRQAMEQQPEMALLADLPLVRELADVRGAACVLPPPNRAGAAARPGAPAFLGEIRCVTPDAPLLSRLRAIAMGPAPWFGMRPADAGWRFASQGGSGRMSIDDGRVRFLLDPVPTLPPAVAAGQAAALPADVLLDFRQAVDRTCTSWLVRFDVRLAEEGLRLHVEGPASDQVAGLNMAPAGILDLGRLEQVPAQALWAAAVVLRPGSQINDLVKTVVPASRQLMVEGRPEEPVDHIRQTLVRANGTLLAWIGPGSPMPVLNVALDLPEAEAHLLIARLGLALDQDGTATAMLGPVLASVGWREGKLLATTDPAGLATFTGAGGFTAQPEVVRALACLPGPVTGCVLVRPAALLDAVMPYLPILGAQVPMPALHRYRDRLAAAKAFGLLTVAGDAAGRAVVDARGSLVLAGCVVLATQTEAIVRFLHIAN
ncbi:MAG: sigma-70 family RNA polymerase sigma factor [Planctomycetes bacterium]|nr:sigma-70 family RNA polymerase sigma factor [Planctomycetota bacterium]